MRGTFDIFVRDSELVKVSSIIQERSKDTEGVTKSKRMKQGTGNWWVFD